MGDPCAFFLDAAPGRRFCVFHPAQAPRRGALLHVPAFGEEMNRSRPTVAAAARRFAAAGFDVLLIDLLGSGDSSGDFGDASWAHWLRDVHIAQSWLDQRRTAGDPAQPLWLWGLRAGCLLACAAQAQQASHVPMLWWQPVTRGDLQLQQWLRLGAAGSMASPAQASGARPIDRLRRAMEAGDTVEIAGYALSPALCAGLRGAVLAPPVSPTESSPASSLVQHQTPPQRLFVVEVAAAAGGAVSPAISQVLSRFHGAGWASSAQTVVDPAFWQAPDIEHAPSIIEASLAGLLQGQDMP